MSEYPKQISKHFYEIGPESTVEIGKYVTIRIRPNYAVVIGKDEMTALVRVWCDVNGLPFPWGGCVPEHDEIEAAKGEEHDPQLGDHVWEEWTLSYDDGTEGKEEQK